MTQAELDALPEDGVMVEMNGKPHYETVGALWAKDDEPCAVTDAKGQRWMIGWAQGVRWKRRVR